MMIGNAHRHATNESLVINNENLLELGPSEDRETRRTLLDEKCEELKFTNLYFYWNYWIYFSTETLFNAKKIFT